MKVEHNHYFPQLNYMLPWVLWAQYWAKLLERKDES